MVRALTKRKETGELYTRRPEIEACLVDAVRQAPATLRQRAAISDPKDPQFLPAEALVHLGREALRAQDMATAGTLIDCLGRRCQPLLKHTIRPSNRFDAEELRAQVRDKLYDLFADEVEDPNNNALDYYEAQFNAALTTLRADVFRQVQRYQDRFVTPSPAPAAAADGGEADDDELDIEDSADESPHYDPVVQMESLDALRRIQALPPKEREAFVWKGLGFETESINPDVKTVATLCGVTGRAVRDRLRSAKARLERMEEEES